MFKVISISILTLVFSFNLLASDLVQSVERGKSNLTLFGLIDLHKAKEYLKRYDLKPVEASPGKALVSISIAEYFEGSVNYESLPFLIGDYIYSYSQFLVENPMDGNEPAYLKENTLSTNFYVVWLERGKKVKGSFFMDEHFPKTLGHSTITGRLGSLDRSQELIKLYYGSEINSTTDVISVLNTPQLVKKGKKLVNSKEMLSGDIYLRNFNPALDTFFVSPKTDFGNLLKNANFEPTSWHGHFRSYSKIYNE